MLLSDLTTISLRQLYRNQRRYKSVIIGIALGIAGFVTVLTMGDSVESDLGHNLELLGAATIVKATYDYDRMKRWHHGQYYDRDIEQLRNLPGAKSVSPAVFSGSEVFAYGDKKVRGRLIGVQDNFFQTIYIPVSKGRQISEADEAQRRSVCVVGPKIIETLLPKGVDPIGQKLLVGGHTMEIIGIVGGVEDKSLLESILIPMSVARSRIPNMYEIRDIYIRAVNWDMVAGLQEAVRNVVMSNQPGYSEGMEVRFYPERIETIKRAVMLVKLFLYAALAVTLLLAGLGITNVMLAAVRERTTEIGLRKAVGATERMIMNQFLLESVSISLMGALVGILVGLISVEVLKSVMETTPAYEVFVASLIGGVIFSVLLGIASGYVPAKRASRLDAAEAMRFE
ncbi:MAG: ABC transporter permease [Desulfomonilaceae bacterium]|nr:ABC transporter permease [Desulfomonilaceae bacterium]